MNLLKPPGMSSHDAVAAVRKYLGIKKVGHGGTLDPGAAGVLPVAVGRAARLIEFLAGVDKAYRAEMLLGFSTDSGDDTGTVVERLTDFPEPSDEELLRVMKAFTGEISQVPPKFSAVKVGGRRACDIARRDGEVELQPRRVRIYDIKPVARRKGMILLDIGCSKGTYIRSLCGDMGKAMGIPASMGFLLRTRVGEMRLEDSVTLEELKLLGKNALLSPGECLSFIAPYEIPEHRRNAFCNGLPTDVPGAGELPGTVRVCCQGEFLGIGRFDSFEKTIVPWKVYGAQI